MRYLEGTMELSSSVVSASSLACKGNLTDLGVIAEQASLDSPADIMAPYFQNQSCNPFTPTSTPCTLGNYVPYSVNVSCAEDVVAGLQFAKKKNVRLVIKNTGHEYAP